MFTKFVRDLGVEGTARFIDVWSFEEDTLSFFPQPILAVCVLYPSGLDKSRTDVDGTKILPGDGSECFYIKQRLNEVGNACGTLALMHAVCNNVDKLEFNKNSPLLEFITANKQHNAEQIADAVNQAKFLREATQAAASTGQTETPAVEDNVDAHFIAFVLGPKNTLLELDGMKPGPVNHGACSADDLFARAIKIVREDMMSKTSDVNFSVLALTTAPEE